VHKKCFAFPFVPDPSLKRPVVGCDPASNPWTTAPTFINKPTPITGMQLTFLGTACMMPTKDRNHTAVLLEFNQDGLLFDCGEGTQRQLRMAGIRPTRITKLLISHWHGDHILGLPGLLQTLGASDYQETFKIFGPEGSKRFYKNMTEWFFFDRNINVEVHEVKTGTFFETEKYMLEALPLDHGIPTIGFRFIEKDRKRIKVDYVKKLGIPDGPLLGKLQSGKSITWKGKKVLPSDATYDVKGKVISYITDTGYCKNCIELAKDADVLISEGTFGKEHQEKADAYGHLSVEDAAKIANQAGAKKLILTHFSQRYKDTTKLAEDAKTLFPNTTLAHDLMKVRV